MTFRFIDLFAGIGGFRIALEEAGATCVYSNEIDKYACATYAANFGDDPVGDITEVGAKDIPEHDILAAGFPCQPFSLAGVSKYRSLNREHGLRDQTKGTLFFDIARILAHHKPKSFILENVKNLKGHDKGRTWKIIKSVLEDDLGYTIYYQIIDAAKLVPQHRERLFIVGFREPLAYEFPVIEDKHPKLRDILVPDVDSKYTLTDNLWEYLQKYKAKHQAAGHGFGYGIAKPNGVTRTLSARYYKDGSEILIAQKGKNPRRLTPRECARLQGYPDSFEIPVSDTQAYRQFGNSVAVPIVKVIAKSVIEALKRNRKIDKPKKQSSLLRYGSNSEKLNFKDRNSLDLLIEKMRNLDCDRIIVKELAENDNSKNQVYLGPRFDALTLLPAGTVLADRTGKTPRYKAPLRFAWLDEDNIGTYEAPNTQLILYPKYPEVRMSGFLRGCKNGPNDLMTVRQQGRILFLGVSSTTGTVYGKVVSPDSDLAIEYRKQNLKPIIGVFTQLLDTNNATLEQLNPYQQLIDKLKNIYRKKWLRSRRLNADGDMVDCKGTRCIGYTLEAEFGIRTNGLAEPDYFGWEIKGYTVGNSKKKPFSRLYSETVTLFTPEPDSGIYVDEGLKYFLEKYGYSDSRGIRFTGVHRRGQVSSSGLLIDVEGFNHETSKITDADGGIVLTDPESRTAARWGFPKLIEHWCKKHSKAVYVPATKKFVEAYPHYKYGNLLRVGRGTRFEHFLKAFCDGAVYYDPAPRINIKGEAKKRSQFRIRTPDLPQLYDSHEMINLAN